jgi:hypothetical protein
MSNLNGRSRRNRETSEIFLECILISLVKVATPSIINSALIRLHNFYVCFSWLELKYWRGSEKVNDDDEWK